MHSENPYKSLPSDRFWRSAVVERSADEPFAELWTPKFPVGADDIFLTAGSCFAQHISGWLRRFGYNWLDAEPAPASATQRDREAGGYGVFSWRTGNIYTPALLGRWVRLALADAPEVEETYLEGGRYFDPLRPTIPEPGFESLDALVLARESTLAAIRSSIQRASVFIFTLGLTEAWVDSKGEVYASCPGTVRGYFDPQRHRFKNYSYSEIVRDLSEVFDVMRSVNDRLKFILTVSPVPLVATASGAHILVATSGSKAVLRAAAGELADSHPDVDYFPSYELIASTPVKGAHFEDNLRSVKPEGVDFVMRHFELGLSRRPHPQRPTAAEQTAVSARPDDDVVCEEILLDSWSPVTANESSADVCLIGDSHMGKLSQSLLAKGLVHAGGMIMNGSAWASDSFELDPREILIPNEGPDARARWKQVLPFFGSGALQSDGRPKVILTNVGMQSHRNAYAKLLPRMWASNEPELSDEELVEFFSTCNRMQLSLCADLVKRGYMVVAISDPPTQERNPMFLKEYLGVFELYDAIFSLVLAQAGCVVLNAREYLRECGFTGNVFSNQVFADGEPDAIHGSDQYYDVIAERIMAIIGAAPQLSHKPRPR